MIMKNSHDQFCRKGFTLLEISIVLAVMASAIIVTMTIYSRVSKAAERVEQEISSDNTAVGVLQLIAEDIDRISASGEGTEIRIENKSIDGIDKSQMILTSYIYDNNNKKQPYERVTWRSYFDEYDRMLYLYRAHGGIVLEDTMLDKVVSFSHLEGQKISQEQLQENDNEMFVPICRGMSLFEFCVPADDDNEESEPKYSWSGTKMPNAVTINISFAEPIEDVFGDYIIPEDKIYTRTAATDRLRDIDFQFVKKTFELEDPNLVKGADNEDPNGLNEILDTIENSEDNDKESNDN